MESVGFFGVVLGIIERLWPIWLGLVVFFGLIYWFRKSLGILGQMLGNSIGIAGLLVLMRERLAVELSPMAVPGSIAVIAATFSYALGSVLSRPLLERVPSLSLAAVHNVIGGLGLAVLSFAFETIDASTLRAMATAPVLASLAFLVPALLLSPWTARAHRGTAPGGRP